MEQERVYDREEEYALNLGDKEGQLAVDGKTYRVRFSWNLDPGEWGLVFLTED